MTLQTLTPSEEEIMQLIWNKNKAYFREIMDSFPEPKPHQNTVSTFLKILVAKHYLTTEKEGRIFRYTPTVGFHEYRKHIMHHFLEKYFDNSAKDLVKLLTEEKLLEESKLKTNTTDKRTKIDNNDTSNHIQDFIKEITGEKKLKKDKKKKDKKKKK